MTLAFEIFIVIAAIIFLVMSGMQTVRSAMGFGRSAKAMNEHVQPRIMALMSQSDIAQQRVFSITGNSDTLQRNVESLRVAFIRLRVIIDAIREISERASRGIRVLGF